MTSLIVLICFFSFIGLIWVSSSRRYDKIQKFNDEAKKNGTRGYSHTCL